MASDRCPHCSHDLSGDATACPACGYSLKGAAHYDAAIPPDALPPSEEFPMGKLSPALLEWARREFNEEEFLAGLREVEETGGLELKDFIHELEEEAGVVD